MLEAGLDPLRPSGFHKLLFALDDRLMTECAIYQQNLSDKDDIINRMKDQFARMDGKVFLLTDCEKSLVGLIDWLIGCIYYSVTWIDRLIDWLYLLFGYMDWLIDWGDIMLRYLDEITYVSFFSVGSHERRDREHEKRESRP